MAKGWRKNADYNALSFGTKLKEAREFLRSFQPPKSTMWTQEHLAQVCEVKHRGTFSQIESGARFLDPQRRNLLIKSLVEELESLNVDETRISRRKLLIAGLSGFLAANTMLPNTMLPNYIATHSKAFERDMVLHMAEDTLKNWNFLLYSGQSEWVLAQATDRYDDFTGLQWIRENPKASAITVRIGLMKARAQEIVLPWEEACRAAAATYTEIEQQFLNPTLAQLDGQKLENGNLLASEHNKLLDSRARMRRRIGQFHNSIRDLNKVVSSALEIGDIAQEIDAHFKLAHVLACLGLEKLSQHQLALAERVIGSLSGQNKSEHEMYLRYYHGERSKRLAYDPYTELSPAQRERYAREGYIALTTAHKQIGERWLPYEHANHIVGFHPLYARMSELQCLAWGDPVATRIALNELRTQAQREFPSLTTKIDLSLAGIDQIEAWKRHNPMPGFDLDAGNSPHSSDAHQIREILA